MKVGRQIGLGLLTLISVGLIGAAWADAALEGWWRFAGTDAALRTDSSGNGHTATVDLTRVERIPEAPGGGAMWFGTGTNAALASSPVFVPGLASVSLTGAFTVAAWVYLDSAAPFAPILVRTTDADGWYDGFGVYVSSEGGLGAFVRSGDDANAVAGCSLRTNGWNHVAVTYSGARLVAFVDGIAVVSRDFTEWASANSAAPLVIGTLAGSRAVQPLDGAIADVRVWSRALGDPEIQSVCRQFLGAAVDPFADDDGDGMPNGWEVHHGLDPRNAADAAEDADGDGLSNLREFRLGRTPTAGAVRSPSLIRSCTVGIP